MTQTSHTYARWQTWHKREVSVDNFLLIMLLFSSINAQVTTLSMVANDDSPLSSLLSPFSPGHQHCHQDEQQLQHICSAAPKAEADHVITKAAASMILDGNFRK